ncbi:MAG: DinB family protein [Candidatus Hydrogenedentota bacterium]
MTESGWAMELESAKTFFNNSTACLAEEDADYAPVPGVFTVKGHVAHVARTVEWLMEGAFGAGWDLDFEKQAKEAQSVASLAEARAWVERAFAHAKDVVSAKTEEDLGECFPADDPIMPGAPKLVAVSGISDHTAHHRGALTVYARLCGKVPAMPYA